ncbi:type VI secretion system tube protein Hcp [Haloferula sp. BvORR071]|uniref:Hcp family type VI secretion system effector n=1 Tax=Haloferula sp. BvORR071 TaxID=1396141 RepID=UPI0006987121|nr:type VI secretion system tube protein Hcp [Haloferula sp. BvORR071]
MNPIPSLSRTLALTAPAVALTLASAHAASDYLLEIEGIKGESKDSKHRDAIEIESFSWGCSNSGSAAKVINLVLSKPLDKASPQLFLACAKGNHIPQAILTLRKTNASGGKTDYYQVTLTDILVSSYQNSAGDSQSGGGGGAGGTAVSAPADRLSFYPIKLKVSYTRLDETGEPMEEPVVAEYDFSGAPQ